MIPEFLSDTQRSLATIAKHDLVGFAIYTKPNYMPAEHHYKTAEYLEKVERGEIKRLMIFQPPRHGKSELSTRRFPAWYLGRNPNKQIISSSYNSDLAADFGRDVRNIIADELYQQVFPGVGLRQDSKAADRWNTNNGGCYIASGVGGGITGRGADLGLIDDPFKDRKEANSQTVRENVWNWYISTFYTRLMPGAAIVLTLTRWHEDDLAGRLLAQMKEGGDQWTVLNLPAIAIGSDELGREKGDALWPAWYSRKALDQIKQTLGSREFTALYQQSPYTEEGNIFLKEYWRFYREAPDFSLVIQSWDTAFKEGEDNDYSACTTWGLHNNSIYLIDLFYKKLKFPDLKRTMEMLYNRHKPKAVLIEDKASGQSLIQVLQDDKKIPVIPIKTDRDKVSRAHAATPIIEAGGVFLPEWANWTDDYINQMAIFPSGEFDDIVDSSTQGLNYLSRKTNRQCGKIAPKPIIRKGAGSWM